MDVEEKANELKLEAGAKELNDIKKKIANCEEEINKLTFFKEQILRGEYEVDSHGVITFYHMR